MILKHKHINIHYTVEGQGEAIILLHGFLENVTMWDHLIPEFSKNHKVVCIDLLGHGKTDCLGYVHTMEDMADAIWAVIETLKIEKANVIGHSMGGYVALAMAEKQPYFFNCLCLMNSTFEADSKERKKIRKRAIEMAQTQYENLVKMSFANLFALKSKDNFAIEYNNALTEALKTPLQGYIAAQEGMQLRPNRFEVFNSLEANKLIIAGKKDTLIDISYLENKIENSTIEMIQLSEGHMSHIENKSELSYILKHFIEK